jgi:hypothetical protein
VWMLIIILTIIVLYAPMSKSSSLGALLIPERTVPVIVENLGIDFI